jgi:hypothetical protein
MFCFEKYKRTAFLDKDRAMVNVQNIIFVSVEGIIGYLQSSICGLR